MPNKNRPYNGIYDDIEYCREEIRSAWTLFCNRNTTEEQFRGMFKGIGLVYLYCPNKLKSIAQATVQEALARKEYYIPIWEFREELNNGI